MILPKDFQVSAVATEHTALVLTLCALMAHDTQTGRCFVHPVWEEPEASFDRTEQQREVDKARQVS